MRPIHSRGPAKLRAHQDEPRPLVGRLEIYVLRLVQHSVVGEEEAVGVETAGVGAAESWAVEVQASFCWPRGSGCSPTVAEYPIVVG